MRTRESVWQKHYNPNALFVRANFGCTLHRDLVDRLITSTKPLAKYKPEFDLLYECRKIHESLSNINASVLFYIFYEVVHFVVCLISIVINVCLIAEPNIVVIEKDCADIGKRNIEAQVICRFVEDSRCSEYGQ